MKRRALLSLLVAFFVGSLDVPVDAAKNPVPGATCSPAGSSRTVKGVKYTCVKKGKKSTWAASTSAPTETTTTTTIPADSLNYKGKMIYGIKDALLTRKADSGNYYETDSRQASADRKSTRLNSSHRT